jgi:sulfite reductase alpha subunit-like flavoprotein
VQIKYHSEINVCVLHCISMMTQLETLMSKNTINVEHTLDKDSTQVSRSKSLNIIHQNVRGLGNNSNELYCRLHHDLPHILCLSEHHLSESKLQLIYLTYYH